MLMTSTGVSTTRTKPAIGLTSAFGGGGASSMVGLVNKTMGMKMHKDGYGENSYSPSRDYNSMATVQNRASEV